MCTLGYLLHEIDGTSDIIIGVKHNCFLLLGGITGTYQHVFACINLNENLWEVPTKPSFFTCFDLCRVFL
jgi:hypothetical protein